jgi:DNA-binding transcriptional MerR regulator
MAELTDATGLTERTIRFYIAEGLVSPALGRGRSRYYTPQHLQELTRVAAFREQRLSVQEIREQMFAAPRPNSALTDAPAWRRIALHPALELHVREGAPEGVLALARALEEQSRGWLGDDGDDLAGGT